MSYLSIKNIVFDLGGVILDINPALSYEAFANILNAETPDTIIKHLKKNDYFNQLETGKISPHKFRNEIRRFADNELSDNTIDTAWSCMLVNFPQERIDLLKKLKSQYRTFLLSNTNAIHERYFTNLLKTQTDVENLSELFEKVYYSHELKSRKPTPEAFQKMIKDAQINPEETLFIDDLEENIKAAQTLKIKTVHLTPAMNIVELFKKTILRPS